MSTPAIRTTIPANSVYVGKRPWTPKPNIVPNMVSDTSSWAESATGTLCDAKVHAQAPPIDARIASDVPQK